MSIKLILRSASICIFTTISCIYPLQSMGYDLIDLGTLGGAFSDGEDLNSNGHVTGTSETTSGEDHAFFYDGSSMQDLGKLDVTHTDSNGNGINDSDQITGTSSLTPAYTPVYKAFLYNSGTMHDLGITGSRGHDVNNSGQVAGWFVWIDSGGCCSSGYVHAFLYDGTTMLDLKTLAGPSDYDSVDSYGYGINKNGWVTGVSETSSTSNASPEHAFVYDGNNMRDLGTLGGSESAGYGINDSGQVTGYSEILGDTGRHAFLYSGSTMQDLGTLGGVNSEGYGINNSGYVVGKSQLVNAEYTAFLYNGNSMLDLCALTDCKTHGWSSLDRASSINDRGDITGSGKINGETHAFLALAVQVSATPVANDDSVNVDVDTEKDIDVIANDTDVEDGSPPIAPPAVVIPTTSTSTQGFVISAKTNGSITYAPADGFLGTDDFKYTLTDSSGLVSTPATVNITVATSPADDSDSDGYADIADNCTVVVNVAQRDTDGDGYGNICDPDFDNNLIVNAADLALFKMKFFTQDPDTDLNGDGIVNAGDLAILKLFFFSPPGPSGLVP